MYSEMLMTIKLYQNDTQVTDAWDAVQSVVSTFLTLFNISCKIFVCTFAQILAKKNLNFDLGLFGNEVVK